MNPMNTVGMLIVDHDFVLEDQLSRLIGYPEGSRALEAKRLKGVIPRGVYATIDGRVTYSIKRYNAWMESVWPREKLMGSQRGLNSSEKASAFDSPELESAAARPSPSRKPRRASKQPPVLELR